MKEIAIPLTWLAIFVILFLIIGNVSISFKPFHIYIPDWPKALGIILMIAGLLLFCAGERSRGYRDGLKKGERITWEEIQKRISRNEDSEDKN